MEKEMNAGVFPLLSKHSTRHPLSFIPAPVHTLKKTLLLSVSHDYDYYWYCFRPSSSGTDTNTLRARNKLFKLPDPLVGLKN